MIIEAYRGDGLRVGSPIVEPLLSNDALLHRARAEMDANAHAFNSVQMDVVFRPGMRLGQMVESTDPTTARPFRAKVTGIQIRVTQAAIDMTVDLEQPR